MSNLNFVGGYLGYFPLGAWLARKRPPSRPVLWAAAAVSYAVIAVGILINIFAVVGLYVPAA